MESATDALKIAFAVFVFVVAMAVIFIYIAMAKSTADTVLYYADETNYYAYAESKLDNRTVGVEEVISTLYRCYNESISVDVKLDGETYTVNTDTDENKLQECINALLDLSVNPDTPTFIEDFVDVPYSGTYAVGEDGAILPTEHGGSILYVTYEQCKN